MPKQKKNVILHTKDKGKMAKCCKGVIPALKLILTLRMIPAWNGMEQMMMWHAVEIIVAL